MKRYLFLLFFIGTIFICNGQIIISEFCASNYSSYYDSDFNTFSDWIELYNTTNTDINIEGYYLTDNKDRPDKWKISNPITIYANWFVVFSADNNDIWLHTNFKLQKDGGFIAIYDSELNLLDSITYKNQRTDVSYGRINNSSNNWVYFNQTTPNNINSENYFTGFSTIPVFSHKGGIYKDLFDLIIEAPGTIRYTTDGSTPTENSNILSSELNISSNSIIRAIAFESNKLPSDVITNTYIINDSSTIPIVSITTDPPNLWDDEIGIYVVGTNGIPGLGRDDPVNWNQDWERPINFEFFDENGVQQVSMQAGIKIAGGWSRARDQKPVAIFARNRYGTDKINYPFFSDKPQLDTNKSLFLRNFGNDWDNAIIRDPVMQYIASSRMDIDYQSYIPVRVYLNNEYWGLQAIREKVNEHYVSNNFNVPVNNVDIFEIWHTSPENTSNIAMHGSAEHYKNLLDFVRTHDLSDQENYTYIKRFIDTKEYINYHIAQIYYANTDWPGNNVKIWRNKEKDGIYRWILFDTDFGLGLYGRSPDDQTLALATDPNSSGWPNPRYSTLLLRKLLENNEFQEEFIQSFMYHIFSTFDPDRILSIIDSFKNDILGEVEMHFDKWGLSYYKWENEISVMKNFSIERQPYMVNQLRNTYSLQNPVNLSLRNDYPEYGTLYLNDQMIQNQYYNGQLFTDLPAKIIAKPLPGYIFDGWYSASNSGIAIINRQSEWIYYNNGDEPAGDWKTKNFDASDWNTGFGEFGYGDGDENTELSYGSNINDKYISYYFRKKFIIDDTSKVTNVSINILRDDGAVVYINGIEALRTNMPDGDINYNTLANLTDDELNYYEYTVQPELLINDTNIIAVELHQTSNTSSDISFDLELNVIKTQDTSFVSQNPEYIPGNENSISLIAKFSEGSKLEISEINYSNNTSLNFVEIKNLTKDTLHIGDFIITNNNSYTIPVNEIVLPYGFYVFAKDTNTINTNENNYLQLPSNFSLNSEGTIVIKNTSQNTVDSVTYINSSPWPLFEVSDNNSIELTLSNTNNENGGNWHKSNNNFGTPGKQNSLPVKSGNVYINEILTSNSKHYADERGDYNDLIEIYNPNDFYIDLCGYYLSDTLGLDSVYQLPESSSDLLIAPKDYLVFWADNEPDEGPLHLGFKLRRRGEMVSIYNKNLELIDRIQYNSLYEDVTYQRVPDGSNNWQYSSYPTLAYKNLLLNNSPHFTSNPEEVAYQGITYLYKISAIDFEGDNILFEVEDIPYWLELNDNGDGTANLFGRYDSERLDSFAIIIKAYDGTLAAPSYQEFTVNIKPVSENIDIIT
ncbi:CotH kinase family protein, partial [Bacteroidota bacterium]